MIWKAIKKETYIRPIGFNRQLKQRQKVQEIDFNKLDTSKTLRLHVLSGRISLLTLQGLKT